MIVLDALTLNTDRHLKNFGILYDADSLDVIGMAPIFDGNMALCPYADIEDLRNLEQYMSTRTCAFVDGFYDTAQKCMTEDVRSRLIQLRGFSFSRNHRYHLPAERLELLSEMVNRQIDRLLL